MTVWIPTDENTKYGVVIYNYKEEAVHRLKLNVGDTVHLLKENADWFYGYNTRNRHQRGIFPKRYIHIKEASLNRSGTYETICPKESPIVQEITSVLREWGAIWKQLYIVANSFTMGDGLADKKYRFYGRKASKRTDGTEFERVRKKMNELMDWRTLIMSSKLTLDELKELKQKVTNKIDMGNALLDLDLVVRDDQGNILDPTKSSTINLYREHQLATQRIQEEKESSADRLNPRKTTSFCIFASVKNFVCRIGDDADILMTLYDSKQGQFISENYVVKWSNQGVPKDIELLNNLRVLFTDLGAKDASRDKVYLVCQVIRIGRMDLKDSDHKRQTRGIKRPFGVAAIDVTDIIKGTATENDEDKQYFIPFMLCGEKDFMDTIIRKIVSAKEVNHKGQGLWVTLQKLHGDFKQVQKEFPHLISQNTSIARKMGFPDVIMPGDVRNDIYVTINQGEFKRGSKTSDKNVEVSMCVCNQDGQILQNVISDGAGGSITSHYKSVLYYHEDKPKWYETVKVAIPIDDFYGSHLKFTFKHRSSTDAKDKSEKPFAMAFVKLMQDNGTTLGDTVHDLLVYKIDPKRQEDHSVYLKLPSTRQMLYMESKGQQSVPLSKVQITAGPLALNTSDSFQISTLVCSTKLTHNVDLMGLLKWRDNPAGLKDHLVALMNVDGEEVVKFLQDTLDALFNILMQNSDSDLYDNLVFDALIFIIGLISDRKYSQFRPVLDVYIKENFSATLAYNKLMVVLKYYVEHATDRNQHDSLLKAMKSLEYIFKFIIRSRILFAALNENRGKQQFEISLKQVFDSINKLMKSTADNTVTVQGAALRYFPSAISDIISVFDPTEFSATLVEFINSVPKDRLTQHKMKCVNEIIHSSIFRLPECRAILLPVMMCHVKQLLERNDEHDSCSKILSDVMDLLFHDNVSPHRRVDLSTIAVSIVRTVIQTVITMDRKSKYIGNYVAVLIAILRQMTEHHFNEYLNHFPTMIDLTDFLMEILMVFRDLVSRNVYPRDWNEMIMLQNSVLLKSLRCFSHTIRDRFSEPFEYQLWNNFFHCAISFLTQEPLQLENFSTAKRTKIISRYKDMRRETGFEIRSMWFNLGQHKIAFIPEIVGPILEMTLIPESELRKATIPIFFDMMQCEFYQVVPGSRTGKPQGHFHQVEDELITQLDVLVEGGRGDELYKQLFYTIMYNLCDGHTSMREQGLTFVEIVKRLMQRLLEYRAVINDENKENRMSCTVNLLNFYHDINRKEMYIRYLHKLCDLHLECDNYTEAAYTLMLYAKLLHWSDEALPQILQSDKYPDATTHRELKEKLYYSIIGYFDKGKMWEKGLELCKELAHQYETETFDYIQLSNILKQQAEFYDRIMKQTRPEPEYFRVGYYGSGFPPFLQNKVFIYRGKEYELLSDFTARLQNQFPNAQLLKILTPPGDEVKTSPSQFLQINAVTPVMEPKKKFLDKRVHQQILKYYRVNEVQKFTFSRRMDKSKGDDFTNMWLERTNLTISYPLPGILRWFPVTSTHTFELSPLENAVETMETTNQRIKSLIDQHRWDPGLKVDSLGLLLNGVVDAAVSGGIANYKVFFSEEYAKNNPRNLQQVQRLRNVTLSQLVLLQLALDIHGRKAPEILQPLQAHMEEKFQQMKVSMDSQFGIKVTDEAKRHNREMNGNVRKNDVRQTMPPGTHDDINISFPAENLPMKAYSTIAPRSQSVMVARNSLSPAKITPGKTSPTPNRDSPARNMSRVISMASVSSVSSQSSQSLDSTSVSGKSDNTIIELSEQITPLRPPRPESGRFSRPSSAVIGKISKLSTNENASTIDIDGATGLEAPPPLPQKQSFGDYVNADALEAPMLPARKSTVPRMSRLEKPRLALPTDQAQDNHTTDNPPKKPIRPPPKLPDDGESEA